MSINELVKEAHAANKQWWLDLSNPCCYCDGSGHDGSAREMIVKCRHCTGNGYHFKQCNVGELLMLITSELSEAMEGDRKSLMDDKLPHRKMFEVEIADALIRLLDLAGGMGLDLQGAYEEKMAFNRNRADHKIENRLRPNGKSY